MDDPLVPGCIVRVRELETLGPAKLVAVEKDSATVEWFYSIAERQRQVCPTIQLERALPSNETRCYVEDYGGADWRMGRTQRIFRDKNGPGWMYEVYFPGDEADFVPEASVYVRCYEGHPDPVETLAQRAHETPFFQRRRRAFVESLLNQRAASEGLSGLFSARVKLYAHQVEVVRRVLSDPVQRYLLADEVGLGKTVEAGAIVRQMVIDAPRTQALIVTPPQLKNQWREELANRFRLDPEDNAVYVISTDDIVRISDDKVYDIVVMDEAHHVAHTAYSSDRQDLWIKCKQLCHRSPRLLLLSATPALHNERDFLAMLHLLEPQTYGLDDLAAFEAKVVNRQPIGQLLLQLTEGTPRPLLRMIVGDLYDLFPGDVWLSQKADLLREQCEANEFDQPKVDSVIREVRVHICETHRIYRRMLRSSRALLEDGVLVGRSFEIDEPPVTVEGGFDMRVTGVEKRIDEWREAAAAQACGIGGDRSSSDQTDFARVLTILVSLLGADLELLEWACRARIDGQVDELQHPMGPTLEAFAEILTSVPLFSGEKDYIEEIIEEIHFEEPEGTQLQWLAECAAHYLGKKEKRLVVFTSYTPLAHAAVAYLRAELPECVVAGHLDGMTHAALRDAIDGFVVGEGPSILVCDTSGEEGVNLQNADRVFHLDLPFDANRLEQRIGRVDRIGRHTEVKATVFVGSRYERSLQDAWFRMLESGFAVFSQSIADLQFYVDRTQSTLSTLMLLEGASALLRHVPEVQEGIRMERQALREQNALDEIQAFENDQTDTHQQMLRLDRQWRDLQESFEGWAVDVLNLRATVPDVATAKHDEFGWSIARHGHDVVHYEPTENTLAPANWKSRVAFLGRDFGSFSREIALSDKRTSLFRVGHPLVTILQEYVDWDDRGQASAMWRVYRGVPESQDYLFFQVDYAVDTDIQIAAALLDQLGFDAAATHALRRQGDTWLPPMHRTLYVTPQLKFITKPAVVEVLARPYQKPEDGGSDYNLDNERLWALDDIVSADRWPGLCHRIRSLADKVMRKDPVFQRACEVGARRGSEALERRMDQLRRGLIYRALGNCGLGEAEEAVDVILGREKELYQALIGGIRSPKIRLDSICAIILSARDPFSGT